MSESLYRKASLVMNPYGALDGELPSIKPTDGSGDFTFSRDGAGASPATRVNASGYIEKGRENLILQSNTFSTTWANSTSSETSGQSGYDGSSDAWLIDKSATSGYIVQSITNSGVQSFSVYAKAGGLNWLRVFIIAGGNVDVYYDLQNGLIGTSTNDIDTSIESIGSGWYRCSVSFNQSITSVRIYPADADNDTSGTSGNIYIQDAQLESGLVATDYIETTTAPVSAGLLGDMPRLDYSGGATCGSLLLEPSRVNSVTQSEYLGSWSVSNATATFGSVSPEGVNNAYSFTTTANLSSTSTSVSVPNDSNTHIMSVFVKNISGYSSIRLRGALIGGTSVATYSVFDLSTGTRTSTTQDGGIEDYGNGWYRIWNAITNNTSGNTTLAFQVFLTNDSTQTNVMEVYGAQAELNASYPTSYIPTYGSASTRGGDNPYNTSATSVIGQTEGTLYAEFTRDELETYTQRVLTLSDGTTNNVIGFQLAAANSLTFYCVVGGVASAVITKSSATTANQKVKIAAAYANNDFVFYVDGVQVGTDSSGSVPSTSQIKFNRPTSGVPFIGDLHQILLFKTRLTNAELAALTTL